MWIGVARYLESVILYKGMISPGQRCTLVWSSCLCPSLHLQIELMCVSGNRRMMRWQMIGHFGSLHLQP